jgi:hypothetical protein
MTIVSMSVFHLLDHIRETRGFQYCLCG